MIFESEPATGGASSASGGAGTSGTPGAAGSGALASAGAAGAPSAVVIDDFEDQDTLAFEPAGWWYTVNDGTSSQSLGVEPDPVRESYTLHTTGQGFSDWGAAIGVDLGKLTMDTRLHALRFRARAASDRDVAVQILDKAGVRFTHTLTITSTWQEHAVRLDQLYAAQGEGFVPLDVSALNELHWFFFGGDAFDVWLDDVVFAPE